MKLAYGAAIAALALTACGEAATTNNAATAKAPAGNVAVEMAAVANAAQPAAPQADLAGARALIDRIYTPYTRDEMGGDLGTVFTAELEQSIERQSDPDMGLGYDPFCSCQDFGQFTYRIVSLEPNAGGATAHVDRSNFGEASRVTLELAHRDGRWLIADIQDSDGSLLNRR